MIDRSKLEHLLGGDQAMVHKFIDIFYNQTPQQIKDLLFNTSENNWESVSITAHAIKSQCRYLGLDDLAERAAKIEQLSEEKRQLDLIPGLAVELEALLVKVLNKMA